MMNSREEVLKSLYRLEQNSMYHGDEAEDWTPSGDADTIRKALAAEEAEVSNTIHEQQIYNSMMYATKKFIDDLRLKGIIIIKEMSDE